MYKSDLINMVQTTEGFLIIFILKYVNEIFLYSIYIYNIFTELSN